MLRIWNEYYLYLFLDMLEIVFLNYAFLDRLWSGTFICSTFFLSVCLFCLMSLSCVIIMSFRSLGGIAGIALWGDLVCSSVLQFPFGSDYGLDGWREKMCDGETWLTNCNIMKLWCHMRSSYIPVRQSMPDVCFSYCPMCSVVSLLVRRYYSQQSAFATLNIDDVMLLML